MKKCSKDCEAYIREELYYFQPCIYLHRMYYTKNKTMRTEDKKVYNNKDLHEYPTMKGVFINTSICYREDPKKKPGRRSTVPRF